MAISRYEWRRLLRFARNDIERGPSSYLEGASSREGTPKRIIKGISRSPLRGSLEMIFISRYFTLGLGRCDWSRNPPTARGSLPWSSTPAY